MGSFGFGFWLGFVAGITLALLSEKAARRQMPATIRQ